MHLLQSWHIRFGHLHLPPGSLRNRSPTLPLSNSNSCTQRDRLHDGYSGCAGLIQYKSDKSPHFCFEPITARIRSSHAGAASLERAFCMSGVSASHRADWRQVRLRVPRGETIASNSSNLISDFTQKTEYLQTISGKS